VPNKNELKNFILREFHVNLYLGDPKYHKTLATVRKFYNWPNFKKEVVDFVTKCLDR